MNHLQLCCFVSFLVPFLPIGSHLVVLSLHLSITLFRLSVLSCDILLQKTLSPQERLKVAVKALEDVKGFVRTLKQREGKETQEFEKKAECELLSLARMTQDDDVCTLMRDQGCIETLSRVINEHSHLENKSILAHTLLVLSNMVKYKKSAEELLESARATTLVHVISWAQGVMYEEEVGERCLELLEIGTEHASLRSFLAKKQWNLTLPGEEEAHRVSLLNAAMRSIKTKNSRLLHAGMGCVANILFDDKGKTNFLEFVEVTWMMSLGLAHFDAERRRRCDEKHEQCVG